jgi:hypothetical protein
MITLNITGSISTNDPISASYVAAANIDGVVPSSSVAVSASYAPSSGGIPIKSGRVLSSSFSGYPLVAQVTFETAWSRGSDYSITITGESTTGDSVRNFVAISKSLDGFIISSNDSVLFNGSVNWQAIKIGEFNNEVPVPAALLVWHRFDDLTASLSDGQSVTYWADASGNNYHMTQSNSSKQPTFKLNRINGKAGIMFDGVDDCLNWSGSMLSALNSAGECELFIIGKKAVQNDSCGLYNIGGDDSDYCLHPYTNGGILECFADTATEHIGGVFLDKEYLTSSFCFNNRCNGKVQTLEISSSGGNYIKCMDEVEEYRFTTTYTSLGYGGRGQLTNAYASCSICEVLIYANQLTNSERSLVKSYLNARYNIA